MSNVLVIAEHLHGKFPKTTLVGVAAGKDLAAKAGGRCVAAVLGQGVDALAGELAEYGVDVIAVDAPGLAHYLADAYTSVAAELVKQKGFEAAAHRTHQIRVLKETKLDSGVARINSAVLLVKDPALSGLTDQDFWSKDLRPHEAVRA